MTKFSDLYAKVMSTPEYLAAGIQMDVALMLESAMKVKQINKADLAKQLGCSKPYVTKTLRGDNNFSIFTLSKMAVALGCDLRIELTPKSTLEDFRREANIFMIRDRRNITEPFIAGIQRMTDVRAPQDIQTITHTMDSEIEHEPQYIAA